MVLILKCQLALFSSYRLDQYADPDGFKTLLGAVLERYPDEVCTYVTDPRTGIQRGKTFPPSIAEIVAACDEHLTHLRRASQAPARPAERPLPLPLSQRPQGYLANLHVFVAHPRYAGFVGWAKTADPVYWRYGKSSDGRDGIWIPWNVWDDRTPSSKRSDAVA